MNIEMLPVWVCFIGISLKDFHLDFFKTKKTNTKANKLYDPFLWVGFNCLKATELLRGDSFLLTTKASGVPGAHLINFERMNPVVDLGATQWFWYWDLSIFPP